MHGITHATQNPFEVLPIPTGASTSARATASPPLRCNRQAQSHRYRQKAEDHRITHPLPCLGVRGHLVISFPHRGKAESGPLLDALEVVRAAADDAFEQMCIGLLADPWAARDDFVHAVIGAAARVNGDAAIGWIRGGCGDVRHAHLTLCDGRG